MYTEITSNTATFTKDLGDEWDSGLTVWIDHGNTQDTFWDVTTSDNYTEAVSNSTTWNEA